MESSPALMSLSLVSWSSVRQIYRSWGPHELRFDMNGGPNILKIGMIKHYRGAEVHEPAHKRMTKIADGVALCDHRNIASK